MLVAPLQSKLSLILSGGMRVQPPQEHLNLAIFPITRETVDSTSYLTAGDALQQGLLQAKELDRPDYKKLLIRNLSDTHLFLSSGEIFEGGRQDRTLKADLLLPPQSQWVQVNVYCTEHGRWQGGDQMGLSESMLGQQTRAEAARNPDQETVWRSITSTQTSLGAPSRTEAAKETYSASSVRQQIADYETHLGRIPFSTNYVVGVAAYAGEKLLGIDLFQDPGVFQKLYPKLLKAYVSAVLAPGAGLKEAPPSRQEVYADLVGAAFGNAVQQTTPGVGELLEVKGNGSQGTALCFSDSLVHLALFPAKG